MQENAASNKEKAAVRDLPHGGQQVLISRAGSQAPGNRGFGTRRKK
jgi:hypothetical protein